MGYFADRYHDLRLPTPDEGGFRQCQLGALHAVASHFTLHMKDRAIITMPTGSGKTAVLIAAAFLLRPERVLVITPSRLVRGQIASRFETLRTLRGLGALADDVEGPRVYETKKQLSSTEDWERLRDYDVVVSTPNAASPAMAGVAEAPQDLFDLVLVDEAHHSPATTWNALLEAFPSAKRVLFTATPFRRDRLEIRGRHIYTYPTRKAFEEKIFGKVKYHPVDAEGTTDADIARAAEQVLQQDNEAGYNHYLVVRVDSKNRANELAEVYESETALNLRVVHSGHSPKRVDDAIADLRAGKLDGVIAVNMIAEGFDLPNLKVAAVHAPYKSLAVTLQFIGRLARTNANDIGEATFVAAHGSRLDEEIRALYLEGAVWEDIIPDLADKRVAQEVNVKTALADFELVSAPDEDAEDLSLYGLRPYFHVKVLRPLGDVDLSAGVELALPDEVAWEYLNDDPPVAVLISRRQLRPKWAGGPEFDGYQYDLSIAYHDEDSGLLFLCSSRRTEPFYKTLASAYVDGHARWIPLDILERALLGLQETNFYNLGLRSNVSTSRSETYRNLTGQRPSDRVTRSDSWGFDLGHLFGTAKEGENRVTIGVTSSSKIWSNRHDQIPNLVAWCSALAAKIRTDQRVQTNTVLDYLPRAGEIDGSEDLSRTLAVTWNANTYRRLLLVDPADSDQISLFDLELSIEDKAPNYVTVRVSHDEFDVVLHYDAASAEVTRVEGVSAEVIDEETGEAWSLVEYIDGNPFELHLADFTRICGHSVFKNRTPPPPFDDELFDIHPWDDHNVNRRAEFNDKKRKIEDFDRDDDQISIQRYNANCLLDRDYEIIFYDHGSGEAADFIALKEDGHGVLIEFYHCKKSGGSKAGAREGDAFDVCGQVVKSSRFTVSTDLLKRHVDHREKNTRAKYLRGDKPTFHALLARAPEVGRRVRVVLVQPGLSKEKVMADDDLPHILGAASNYVTKARCEPLVIWGSA